MVDPRNVPLLPLTLPLDWLLGQPQLNEPRNANGIQYARVRQVCFCLVVQRLYVDACEYCKVTLGGMLGEHEEFRTH